MAGDFFKVSRPFYEVGGFSCLPRFGLESS